MNTDKRLPENTDELLLIPGRHVISVIGAGGKTTCIHTLVKGFRSRGKKVLVTTTTHMIEEDNLKSTKEEIREALKDGYAFAGISQTRGDIRKIHALPDEVFMSVVNDADIVLVEADGARRLPFKVPKDTEPVIAKNTTEIILVAGMSAAGGIIRDVCYNYEELSSILSCAPDDNLTIDMMAEAYRRTYMLRLAREYPELPVYILPGQIHDTKTGRDGERFIKLLEGRQSV